MALAVKQDHDTRTVLAEITTISGTASATTTPVRLARPANGFVFVLDVTAAQTAALDILAVRVQTRIGVGAGANWMTVVRFTDIAGNGGVKQYVEKTAAAAAEAGYKSATVLAAGEVRNIIGDEWRVFWSQIEDTDVSFTFSVTACPM